MTMNGIRDGDSASWDAMIAYARNYSMSNPAYYAELCKKLDVVCFIDYPDHSSVAQRLGLAAEQPDPAAMRAVGNRPLEVFRLGCRGHVPDQAN